MTRSQQTEGERKSECSRETHGVREHIPGTEKHYTVAAALQRQSWKDQQDPFYKSPGEFLKNSGLLLKSHWKVLRESDTIRYTV